MSREHPDELHELARRILRLLEARGAPTVVQEDLVIVDLWDGYLFDNEILRL